jgi:hypothetical protein
MSQLTNESYNVLPKAYSNTQARRTPRFSRHHTKTRSSKKYLLSVTIDFRKILLMVEREFYVDSQMYRLLVLKLVSGAHPR